MWKEDMIYLYVDAELQDTTSAVGPVAYTNQARFNIGHSDAAGPDSKYFFNGSIDDLSFYNRALTEAEIQALWRGGAEALWLVTAPISGTVPGNSSMPVQVTFDATDLQPDTYTTTLYVLSNDPVTRSL
jgi:hypothetical protein